MKRIITLLIFATLFTGINAQTPLTEAVDFTVTSTHGDEINLFDILDDGKIVLLDFFSTTCSGCNYWAPQFQPAYEAFGCGEGNVKFIGIESFHNDAATIAFDELYGIEFPSASGIEGGGSDVFSLFQIQSTPTLIIVNPDRSIPEGQIWNPSTETLIAKIEQEGGIQQECSTGINDQHNEISNFVVFPNPATDVVNVSFQMEDPGNLNVEIMDISGRILEQLPLGYINIGSQKVTMNLSNLSKGFYLIAVKRDNILIRFDKISIVN